MLIPRGENILQRGAICSIFSFSHSIPRALGRSRTPALICQHPEKIRTHKVFEKGIMLLTLNTKSGGDILKKNMLFFIIYISKNKSRVIFYVKKGRFSIQSYYDLNREKMCTSCSYSRNVANTNDDRTLSFKNL